VSKQPRVAEAATLGFKPKPLCGTNLKPDKIDQELHFEVESAIDDFDPGVSLRFTPGRGP